MGDKNLICDAQVLSIDLSDKYLICLSLYCQLNFQSRNTKYDIFQKKQIIENTHKYKILQEKIKISCPNLQLIG